MVMLSGTWENECGEGEGPPGRRMGLDRGSGRRRGRACAENCMEAEEGAGLGPRLGTASRG